jgi:hypothetical protein
MARPSFPEGNWYFNPFCWQLLFVFGGWLALEGTQNIRPIYHSPILQGGRITRRKSEIPWHRSSHDSAEPKFAPEPDRGCR